MTWPEAIDLPLEEYLLEVGEVVRLFGHRADSRATIYGVEVGGCHYVVKTADDPGAVEWLRCAVRFHTEVRHPTIAGLVAHMTTPTGLALVEEWVPGEPLHDPFDASRVQIHLPNSVFNRFRALPVIDILRAFDAILEAHIAVSTAGFVAVDLYDGCVMHDFSSSTTSLIDLDLYRPGPYVLDADRQYGSTSYMAPEEFVRGSTIDERATVFTLGRFAQVFLGCPRRESATRPEFRGSDAHFEITLEATRSDPSERPVSIEQLAAAWRGV